MFVSVVMPAYNAEKYIAEAINSVLNQTHRLFELLIIDDGSTDNTRSIAEEFARRDDRIRIMSHANWGIVATLNDALTVARSDWIARADADDIMLPQWLEKQLALITQTPDLAAASCLAYIIDVNGRITGSSTTDLVTRQDFDRYFRDNQVMCLYHCGVVMRRDIVRAVGGYRPQFWPIEDLDLFNRMAETGLLVLVQPEHLFKYRRHSGSITTTHARRTRANERWLKLCIEQRRSGRAEPTLEQFLELEQGHNWLQRVNLWRQDTAYGLYRSAVSAFSDGQYGRMVTALATSLLLSPSLVSGRLAKKITPYRFATNKQSTWLPK
jgi:glycosyltransferase involved in cell wall biosynthesis